LGPEIDLRRADLAELGEQLPAVLHGRVVGLVRAEEPPDRLELTLRPRRIDLDRDRDRRVGGGGRSDRSGREDEEGKEAGNTQLFPQRRLSSVASAGFTPAEALDVRQAGARTHWKLIPLRN